MRVVSFARGTRWLFEGWRLFKVAPVTWLALVVAYFVLMIVLGLLPLGSAVGTVLIPTFAVGFMAASRNCERRAPFDVRVLFDGFRGRWPMQLVLGGVYLLLLAGVIGGTTLADDGALARWLLTGRRPDDEVLQSDVVAGLTTLAVLYVPVMMLYWFAPVLVAWHSMGVAKALFYSFFASLMNWRAFLGYGAVTALVTVVVPFLMLGALILASGGGLRLGAMELVFPVLILLLPTLFASFYASYRDIFGADEARGG
jgi:hypothetical protein